MPIYKGNKTKDGRQWYFKANYTDKITGTYKSKISGKYLTKKEAEQAERAFIITLDTFSSPQSVVFSELVEDFMEHKKSIVKPQTMAKIVTQCEHIKNTVGNIKVNEMTAAQYEQFRSYLDAQGFCTDYKNKLNRLLISIIKYGEMKYGVYNPIPSRYPPFKSSAAPKEMQFFTLDEFNLFISKAPNIQYEALFNVLYFCGLRVGEANALTWNDIDFVNATLTINKTVNTKIKDSQGNYLVTTPKTSGSNRTIPITKKALVSLSNLHEYFIAKKGFNESWRCFGGLRSLPESSIQNVKNKMCNDAGVKNIRVHDLRHSCASLLVNSGATVVLVSKFLGHSSVTQTLNTYSHLFTSQYDEIRSTLDKL